MKRRAARAMRRAARMLITRANKLDPPDTRTNVFMSAMAQRQGAQAARDLAAHVAATPLFPDR